ncbi:hypothetical protein GCM10022228_12610 [Halomonas cibimaris]|uniref:Phosphatidylglycerophosphatase A n=1 Tax=Halomonas cibimaris TaxID=657012 RepID=A0ABP7LPP8_9GAMM
MDTLNLWLATGFGVGFMPLAPGTWGSLWGLALAWWLGKQNPGRQAAAIAALALLAVPVCHRASMQFFIGDDAGGIVLDEIIALPLALLGLRLCPGPPARRWPWQVVAFGLFRGFDAFKPPPVGWAEALPGGLGIVADDLAAAGLAGLCLAALLVLCRRLRLGAA